MTEKETIRRKIQLKGQAMKLIRAERDQLRHQLNLTRLRDFLEKRMAKDFDPELYAQLDALQFLLESLAGGLQTLEIVSGRD